MTYSFRIQSIPTSTPTYDAFQRGASPSPDDVINELSTAVAFDRPFEYSTSTWTESGNCNKNISRFRVLPHDGTLPDMTSYSSSTPLDAVAVTGDERTPFFYRLTSQKNSPYLKFIIPGNEIRAYRVT